MKVEAALGHCSSPCAPHHAETRLCISLPFSISFIANIARKRPELNRDKSKHRRDLLEAGVELFELRLGATTVTGQSELGRLGLSGASLHSKTFAIDDARIFVGSFNFDPRSAFLNCEMGFLIDSPIMAAQARRSFDDLELLSYRPELTPENRMIWHETLPDGQVVTYQEEPGATWFEQVAIVVIGLLPIEWLL
ncbi:phospholipase D-like domain-containing protein [Yoonia sp. MH D7]